MFNYPRLQNRFIAIIAMGMYLFVYFERKPFGYVVLSVLAMIVIIQAYKAFRYTLLAKKQELNATNISPKQTVSLFICNVYQNNTAYHKVVNTIKNYQPDIVITTESNQVWQAGLSGVEKDYPHFVAIPQDNKYGRHLYSKLPLAKTTVRILLTADIPSVKTIVQLGLGDWIHLFVVHPRPPLPGEDDNSRERDAEIIMVGREVSKETGGVMVAGDFNDVAWSATTVLFQEVNGFLDPRRGRGFFNTFHAKIPVFRWPLDHIFRAANLNW